MPQEYSHIDYGNLHNTTWIATADSSHISTKHFILPRSYESSSIIHLHHFVHAAKRGSSIEQDDRDRREQQHSHAESAGIDGYLETKWYTLH